MRPLASPRLVLATLVLVLAAVSADAAPDRRVPDDHRFVPPPGDTPASPSPAAPRAPPAPDLARLSATIPAARPIGPAPDRFGAEPKAWAPRLAGKGADGKTTVEFPLVHTRVVAQVSGDVARVEVTQYYSNPSPDRLEAIYQFPLPPNAAVTDMLFRIGDRVVVSEVRRREEARQVYEAAKREGKTAALTEQERPNLFTQSVANVPPGEIVAVVLRYVHEVPYDDGRYRFHFPMTIGPRYIPGNVAIGRSGGGWSPDTDRVPDASRVTPSVVAPGFRSGHDVDVLVRLVPGAAFDDVATRSHRVVTGVDGDGARLVALAEDDRIPNKDFELSWRPAGAVPEAHALVQSEKGERFLLLFVQPPADVAPALVRPKELVFLLDKSGSMMGAPIDRAKAVISRALEAMGPDDTFQMIAFDGAAEPMSPAPLAATAVNVARAKLWLAMLSGSGGTEMLTGIRAALVPPADPRRLRMVVFCTDGFIGNEREIIAAVGQLRGEARVFGFGIGTSVNRYLVEGVARAGRGAAEIVSLKDAPDEVVTRLFRRIDRPVLTDLEVAFEGGGEVAELEPGRLPDLFAGQPLVVAGKVRGADPTFVQLRGRLGASAWSARLPVHVAAARGDAQPVAGTLWARRRIDALLAEREQGPAKAEIDATVDLALRFKLVTPYTSFVAVERTARVDPSLPLAQALVPNELPEGVSHEGIFGPEGTVQVLPARVKPGDPELRVAAPPDAVAVRVTLPFERASREAVRDPRRGDFVLRFLVPPAWPEGSFDARVEIVRADGAVTVATAPIRVDATPAPLAVVAAPGRVRPGEAFRVALKPALPLGRAPALLGRPGGLANALKGAMEVKEVLVRAPWGEVARARLEGPLGAYVAALHVPAGAAEGEVALEAVAADAAGNVSRRAVAVRVGAAGAGGVAAAGVGAAPLLVALAGAAVLGGAALLEARGRRRRARLLSIALGGAPAGSARKVPALAPMLTAAPRPRRRRGARIALVLLVALGAAAALWRHADGRARHLAVPVLSDPSLPPAPPAAAAELPPCAAAELAHVGRRVAAVLAASDGTLWVGTFDEGIVRITPETTAAVEGLEGRERFVNALIEHDGLVWAATQGGLLALDDGRRALTALDGEGVTSLAVAHGRLYAGTARGLFRVTAERGAEALGVVGPDGEPVRVAALAAGETRLWMGTPAGAYSVALANLEAPLLSRTAAWHPLVFGDPPATTNGVTALAAIPGGAIAGTDDGGLVRLGDDGRVAAARLGDAGADQVNPGAAVPFAGGVASGTQGGGLVLASARGASLALGRPRGLDRGAVSAVARSGDDLLLGTAEGAVVRLSCAAPQM